MKKTLLKTMKILLIHLGFLTVFCVLIWIYRIKVAAILIWLVLRYGF